MASLLPRFYEITEGLITLDGQPINHINIASLRQQMGQRSLEVISQWSYEDCVKGILKAHAFVTRNHNAN